MGVLWLVGGDAGVGLLELGELMVGLGGRGSEGRTLSPNLPYEGRRAYTLCC